MKRAFWFHYNKPASRAAKKTQVTIHYKGQCLIVDDLALVGVDVAGRHRKSQPYWVLAGKANDITIKNGIATIS
jgi:hypothetical protein